MEVKIAHFSDSHIGYEAYKALSVSGENQRTQDIVKAFANVVSDIIASDPPLVLHSGDLADRTVISFRLMLMIRAQIIKLTAIRPDGSRRQLVIIAGNHELSRNRKEACYLHLFDGLPGVHIVTNEYKQVSFTDPDASKDLENVIVHCLPHDILKSVDFDSVQPIVGKYNVLLAHGVAGGSELYVRSLGREFAIPTDVLARNWSYGALGHWHKQGPINLFAKATQAVDVGSIWYAGSAENMGFGDLRENGLKRGWLHVTLQDTGHPKVERRILPIRNMFRLPIIDGAELNPDELHSLLLARLRSQDIQGAVVGQIVENVPRDIWSLVNMVDVKIAAAGALYYDVVVRPYKSTNSLVLAQSGKNSLGDIQDVLQKCALEILAPHERSAGITMALELLDIEVEKSVSSADANTDQTIEPTSADVIVGDKS
jgi:DNA repair exonuclease SbcCD nuclease subunit